MKTGKNRIGQKQRSDPSGPILCLVSILRYYSGDESNSFVKRDIGSSSFLVRNRDRIFTSIAETVRRSFGWNRTSNWPKTFTCHAARLKKLSKLLRATTMSLNALGKNIFPIEVTHVSSYGVWLLARDRELFMSYEDFPWFKDMPVGKILNVQEPTPGHFYWPDLDVDLSEEIIAHPERFPLKAK